MKYQILFHMDGGTVIQLSPQNEESKNETRRLIHADSLAPMTLYTDTGQEIIIMREKITWVSITELESE